MGELLAASPLTEFCFRSNITLSTPFFGSDPARTLVMPNLSPLDQTLLQTILQSISHAIVLFEPDGQIAFANSFAEHLLGFQPGEWRKNSISCLFLEEDCDIFLPNIVKLTREKGTFEGEVLLRSQKNQEFFAYFNTFLHRHGETEIIICTIQDIGTQKALQRQSIETDRIRSMAKVVDQMAHHIRNPIAAIGGFAARLLKKDLDEKDKEVYQEIILQEANRLDDLLRNLANFTTLPLPTLAEESFERLLDRAVAKVPEQLRTAASEWRTPPAKELRALRAFMDLEYLSQGLANLITNALEAADPSVLITIEASPRDSRIFLSVSDNGRGIKPADLHRVFDPLFTTKSDHMGLGLTISQRIIHDHAGSIRLESKVGQGTTVTMDIAADRRRSIRVTRL
jgi:PAS domain S-box-containing protein